MQLWGWTHHNKYSCSLLEWAKILGKVQPVVLHPVEDQPQQSTSHQDHHQGCQELPEIVLISPNFQLVLFSFIYNNHTVLDCRASSSANLEIEEGERKFILLRRLFLDMIIVWVYVRSSIYNKTKCIEKVKSKEKGYLLSSYTHFQHNLTTCG